MYVLELGHTDGCWFSWILEGVKSYNVVARREHLYEVKTSLIQIVWLFQPFEIWKMC